MAVYDCFMFQDDYEVLDIRLHELENVVDKHVLVECTKTFRGKDKPLYFEENKHLFKDYLDKIVHVVADKPPDVNVDNNPHHRKFSDFRIEVYQRDAIMLGLNKIQPEDNDVILISDCDEIPRAELVKTVSFDIFEFWACIHRIYYYYLNTYFQNNPWAGTMAVRWSLLKNSMPHELIRNRRHGKRWKIGRGDSGGWHFSHLAGSNREAALKKVRDHIITSGHHEFDRDDIKDEANLNKCLDELRGYHPYSGCDAQMQIEDMTFLPEYIQDNPDKFKEFFYGRDRL